jgi:hypothetical protein
MRLHQLFASHLKELEPVAGRNILLLEELERLEVGIGLSSKSL